MLIWPSEHLRQVCADFRHRAFDISVYVLPSYFWQSLRDFCYRTFDSPADFELSFLWRFSRGACNQTFVRLEFAEKYFYNF